VSLLPDDIAAELRKGYLTEVALVCLTFDHPDLSDPILVVNNSEDVVRSAGTFLRFPFTYRDYVKGDSDFPTAEVTADNVDDRIMTALRGLAAPRPTVTYECVLSGDVNTVVEGPMEFIVLGFTATVQTISLRIALDYSFLNDAFPKGIFSPGNTLNLYP
jgi:hypothetical protein